MRAKPAFTDTSSGSLEIRSVWLSDKQNVQKKTGKAQTPQELYQFREAETQSGLNTTIIQSQVTDKDKGRTLIKYLCKKYRDVEEETWRQRIDNGFITVDCEVCIYPDQVLDIDFFIEYVGEKSTIETQTMATQTNIEYDKMEEEETGEGEYELENDPTNEVKAEGKEERKSEKPEKKEKKPNKNIHYHPNLSAFLTKMSPLIFNQLENNKTTKAFDLMDFNQNNEDMSDSINYWKMLSVDLERKKVIFPDWTKAKHFNGFITKTSITRNKERVYDIEYEDGVKLSGVREEYIRILGPPEDKNNDKKSSAIASRLQEGVRVHAKISFKSGKTKYFPGRIVKCVKSRSGAGIYDVECEGSRLETGLSVEDLVIGLSVGQQVEARKPNKISLQCTGLSWNATGNVIAASYGRNDLTGWCDFPGAVCCWRVFDRLLEPDSPHFVLDHPSCLMCVSYHPVNPSLVAAGSFNGEVIVWDLTNPEQPLAVSPIVEYSHKEPVLDIQWVFYSASAANPWVLTSTGADGKVLFWSLSNKLTHPVKGASLSKGKGSSRRHYPSNHGGTVGTPIKAGSGRPKWLLCGQQGGAIVRGQLGRVLGGSLFNKDSFKSFGPSSEDSFFPSIKKGDDAFKHEPHIGAVTKIDCSPFHRNLFLTSGADGVVKLFHILERQPLLSWEPTPSPGTSGVTSNFSAVTSVQFSPIRPLLFAATSEDGFLYIYDLLDQATNAADSSQSQVSAGAPVAVLEAPFLPPQGIGSKIEKSEEEEKTKKSKHRAKRDENPPRVSITGLAFNPKQRDLIAVCDYLGRVHIWKLNWVLANAKPEEQLVLNGLADSQGRNTENENENNF